MNLWSLVNNIIRDLLWIWIMYWKSDIFVLQLYHNHGYFRTKTVLCTWNILQILYKNVLPIMSSKWFRPYLMSWLLTISSKKLLMFYIIWCKCILAIVMIFIVSIRKNFETAYTAKHHLSWILCHEIWLIAGLVIYPKVQ